MLPAMDAMRSHGGRTAARALRLLAGVGDKPASLQPEPGKAGKLLKVIVEERLI
jgi:hypothetical protein